MEAGLEVCRIVWTLGVITINFSTAFPFYFIYIEKVLPGHFLFRRRLTGFLGCSSAQLESRLDGTIFRHAYMF